MGKIINGEYDAYAMRGMINENRRQLGMEPMPKPRTAREVAEGVILAEIASSTGPTGGWLDSPQALAAAIVKRLRAAFDQEQL